MNDLVSWFRSPCFLRETKDRDVFWRAKRVSTSVVWNVRSTVEQSKIKGRVRAFGRFTGGTLPMNSMSTVGTNHGTTVGRGMFLDFVAHITILGPWTNYEEEREGVESEGRATIDGWFTHFHRLFQAFIGSSNKLASFLIDVANEKGLIQIAMEAVLVNADVNWKRSKATDVEEFSPYSPLTISPSCNGRRSGIPWQMISFTLLREIRDTQERENQSRTDVQHDFLNP